ncbi:MAG: aspartyl protease family protein [Candidatus Baltobacteraceae bacterium]
MRFAVATLALLFALTASASARANSLGVLLERMRSAGGPIWSTHLDAVVDISDGAILTRAHIDARGDRLILHRCLNDLCLGRYYHGSHADDLTLNGAPVPAPQLTATEPALLLALSHAFLRPGFRKAGGALALLPSTRNAGYALEIEAPGIAPFIARIGADALIRRLEIGSTRYDFSDYRKLGALRVPARIERGGKTYLAFHHFQIESAPFVKPHPLALAFAAAPVVLPWRPRAKTPIVACSIDGRPLRCLIDSGNSGLSMTLSLAEQLHLQPTGTFEVQGIGDYLTELVSAPPLRIGAATLPRATYVVLSDLEGTRYDVILGTDFLAAASVTIDGPQRRVIVRPPNAAKLADGIPVRFLALVPTVRATLATTPARLLVDTGDESTINLGTAFFHAHPTLFHVTENRSVRGVGGSSIEHLGRIAGITLGAIHLTNLSIGSTDGLHTAGDGHIGSGLLARFVVTFDYERGRIEFAQP